MPKALAPTPIFKNSLLYLGAVIWAVMVVKAKKCPNNSNDIFFILKSKVKDEPINFPFL
jgi:hypothetical protein